MRPEIGVEPGRLEYGNLSVGESQTLRIVVRNLVTSNRSLVVNETAITGKHPGEFAVVNDSGATFTLDPGERRQIEVRFTPRTAGEKQAQLQIVSNAEPSQIDVWLSNTGEYLIVQEVAVDTDGDDRAVNIAGKFITAGSDFVVNISRPTISPLSAKIEETRMTVTRAGNFTMNITHSASPIRPDTAVTASGRAPLQYVSVDYTVPSRTFENTSFVFTVDKATLPAGTAPDEIAFARYADGAWRTQNATLVGESNATYRFRTTTNGYSQFVITSPAPTDGGCELFGLDYGSVIVCWYWWVLAASVGLALVGYRVWRKGLLGRFFGVADDSHRDEAVDGADDE
jgi:hypothetical protein